MTHELVPVLVVAFMYAVAYLSGTEVGGWINRRRGSTNEEVAGEP